VICRLERQKIAQQKPDFMDSRIAFKITTLDRSIQRVAFELGLGFYHIEMLGQEWKSICEAWVVAETALMKAGGSPLTLKGRKVKIPGSLEIWSHMRRMKLSESIDFRFITTEMPTWWAKLDVNKGGFDVNAVIEMDWCGRGLSGIALLLLGLKEWGFALKGRKTAEWTQVVSEVTKIFNAIPSANIL
jgi:hypothetical protein